ncbi:hypothetical protein IAU60_001417 [Kwoniella sp. DSM 27419]
MARPTWPPAFAALDRPHDRYTPSYSTFAPSVLTPSGAISPLSLPVAMTKEAKYDWYTVTLRDVEDQRGAHTPRRYLHAYRLVALITFLYIFVTFTYLALRSQRTDMEEGMEGINWTKSMTRAASLYVGTNDEGLWLTGVRR